MKRLSSVRGPSRASALLTLLFAVSGICTSYAVFAMGQDDEPIKPLPAVAKLDQGKVLLGARLFRETKLSKNNDVSCASCHDFAGAGGADARPRSTGTGGALGPINAPTVLNSLFNAAQLWSGAEPSLEAVVNRVVKGPKLFNTTWPEIVAKLDKEEGYRHEFARVYGASPTENTIVDAIVTFERSLVTPSRFDRFLGGDGSAISSIEKTGYDKFKSYGCVACHQGRNVGGNMYQKFGILGDYFADRGNITDADAGRFNVTKDQADRGVFRVPSLRNVALTAPYFHDGSAKSLEAAVEVMFKYQLGRSAPAEDKAAIVAFLRSLSADPQQLQTIDSLGR